MTKSELKQLRGLRAERDNLAQKIRETRFNPKDELADTVKDYRTGQGKTVVIRGYGDDQWKKLQMKYKEKYGHVVRRLLLAECFLDRVSDAEMRTILRLRYEDGLSYEAIGEKLGYSRQAIQKKEKIFWEVESSRSSKK